MDAGLLEVCADSYASCMAAFRGGADRIELCANLPIGGTTPSYALVSQVLRDIPIPVNVLIRPRFGDFLYDQAEAEEMEAQIAACKELGVNGVVIGALTPDGRLNKALLSRLIAKAPGLDLTLHRCFDMTADPLEALEDAVALGFTTILTSGQQPSAPLGAPLLKRLQKAAAGRITIMAGSGVGSGSIPTLRQQTGIRVYHASCKKTLDSGMVYRKDSVSMGLPSLSEYDIWRTDEGEVRRCKEAL